MFSMEEVEDFKFLTRRYLPFDHLGEGTFSIVYKAADLSKSAMDPRDPKTSFHVALKVITKTTAPKRVLDELRFLKKLGGKKNCVKLLACMRNEDQIVAVFPFHESTEFRSFIMDCTIQEIRLYMYNLLTAIEHIHKHKIIHRDIKPNNFLWDRKSNSGVIIDFGLAQEYHPIDPSIEALAEITNANSKKQTGVFFNGVIAKRTQSPGYYMTDPRPQMKAHRAGTRGFRAPEVLFRTQRQGLALDIWSAGVIFLCLLTRQYPFFHSTDDINALVEIGTIFGHNEMRRAARHYNRVWKSNIKTIPTDRVPFQKIVGGLNPTCNLSSEGYDLLYNMLELNSEKRITAREALFHPFFDDINK
ncbi:putative cell division control protein 7 like protein 1 [Astathelohania contejeani]|uniref:non-specific serine/threonine protein kinase n=1 Tax=Astathelohania contejeani TaxID=164912 RepID=A0ABQ7I2V0_9MICR|nr:putative cell division control protein 7 like protein 1 [Thelohania contejeani]